MIRVDQLEMNIASVHAVMSVHLSPHKFPDELKLIPATEYHYYDQNPVTLKWLMIMLIIGLHHLVIISKQEKRGAIDRARFPEGKCNMIVVLCGLQSNQQPLTGRAPCLTSIGNRFLQRSNCQI